MAKRKITVENMNLQNVGPTRFSPNMEDDPLASNDSSSNQFQGGQRLDSDNPKLPIILSTRGLKRSSNTSEGSSQTPNKKGRATSGQPSFTETTTSSSGTVGAKNNINVASQMSELMKGFQARAAGTKKIVKIISCPDSKKFQPCAFCNGTDSVCSLNISLRVKDVEVLMFLCKSLGINFLQEFEPLLKNFSFCCHCWSSYNLIFTEVATYNPGTTVEFNKMLKSIEKSLKSIQIRRHPNSSVRPYLLYLNGLKKLVNYKPINSPTVKIASTAKKLVQMTPGINTQCSPSKPKPNQNYCNNRETRVQNNKKDPNNSLGIQHPSDPLRLDLDEKNSLEYYRDRGIKNDHSYCTTQIFQCEICHKMLQNSETLMSHYVSDHSSAKKTFVCLTCGGNFVCSTLLKKHMGLHKKQREFPISCDICEDRFQNDEGLHRHLDKHTVISKALSVAKSSGAYTCFICNKVSRTFSNLRKHELEQHKAKLKYICQESDCKQPFSHRYLLQAHEVCHRQENSDELFNSFPCLVCKFEFDTVKALKYHLLIHLDWIERRKNNKNLPGVQSKFFCKYCGKTFHLRRLLLAHEETLCNGMKLECEICPEFYFSSTVELINHIFEKHEAKEMIKYYKCCRPNCTQSFVTSFMYKRHLRNHNNRHRIVRCPLCQDFLKFKYTDADFKAKLTTHLNTHRYTCKEEFKCKLCSMKYYDELTLAIHERQQHPQLFKTHICIECEKSFSQLKHLETHSLTHDDNKEGDETLFSCHCSFVFTSADKLSDHLASNHTGDGYFICEICKSNELASPSVFYGKENLKTHMIKEHSSQASLCPLPTLNFESLLSEDFDFDPYYSISAASPKQSSATDFPTNFEDLLTIPSTSDGNVGPRPQRSKDKKVQCNVCGKTVKGPTTLKRHQFSHPELFIFKCVESGCNAKFIQEVQLFTHTQLHNGISSCKEDLVCYCCSSTKHYSSKDELSQHLRTHTQDTRKICPHCNKWMYSVASLKNHIATFHETEKQIHRCEECGRRFASPLNLKRHMSTHSKSTERLACSQCDRDFKSSASLFFHQREKHSKDQQQCEHCGNMIPRHKLKIHLSKVHQIDTFASPEEVGRRRNGSKPKSFQCYFCFEYYSTVTLLSYHMSKHLKEKPLKCKICPKSFGNPSNLQHHCRIEHGSIGFDRRRRTDNSRPFTCETCGKTFRFSHIFKSHLNFHLGIRNFKCFICEKTFSSNLSRAGHMLSHRSLDAEEINKNEATKAYAKRWKPLTCKFVGCGKTFKTRNQYNYHNNFHTNRTPYKCHICGVRFYHSGWFRGHKKVHVLRGDYTPRPQHLKGVAPDSEDEEGPDNATST